MTAYYNEIDPYAADWLRNLIKAGHIPDGDVDTRSIADVSPIDLIGYDQAHFFAGIAGWPLALRLAGWPDDRPVWTGSCPCQPFSAAGKRKGTADARHLWPEFHRLIAVGNPAVVFGEQVASKDGRLWLAGIRADMEAVGYAVGAADLCAAGVGAPHIRQRLWWVADAMRDGTGLGSASGGRPQGETVEVNGGASRAGSELGGGSSLGGLADADSGQRHGLTDGQGRQRDGRATGRIESDRIAQRRGSTGGLEHAESDGRQQRRPESSGRRAAGGRGESFWSDFDLIPCTDGKARRVEPGTFPLAHGVSARVGRLRAYGNAINPWLAAEFIAAWLDTVA